MDVWMSPLFGIAAAEASAMDPEFRPCDLEFVHPAFGDLGIDHEQVAQASDFLQHYQPCVRDLGPVKVQRQQTLEVLELLEPLVSPHRIVFPAERLCPLAGPAK
jgi:hypothetical protein